MKKILFIAIIGISIATLCSCGSKSGSSEESKAITGDYKKACELREFSTAYAIIDKLKKEEGENVSDEAEKYVVLQEALFVLESKGTDGT